MQVVTLRNGYSKGSENEREAEMASRGGVVLLRCNLCEKATYAC